MDYADTLQPKTPNPAGTKLLLSYAPIDTFDAIQKHTSPGVDLGDESNISTDHTFATGGRFYKLELEVNKNELNAEVQGAVTGASKKFTFTGFMSNLSPAQADIFKKLRREKHIIMVHLADGQVIQLGEENNGAMFKENTQTGLQEGGERGSAITVEAYHEVQFYTGTISYTAAA